jgi:type IV pilus assembly protein PilZ
MSSKDTTNEVARKNSGGVLPVSLLDKQALYHAYMVFIEGGGLFVKTQKQYALGDEIFLLVKLMDDPKKYPVAGRIVWVTPPCAQGGLAAGIGVQFTSKDAVDVHNKIETYLAGALNSERSTDTM